MADGRASVDGGAEQSPAPAAPFARPPDAADRLAELASRSTSETRSILALASPRTHHLQQLAIPESPRPNPPPFSFPFFEDSLLLHTAFIPQDSNMKSRTPKPSTPRPPGTEAGSSPDMPRPLNVTDALSYLDAVKMQFADKPDVYNHFLDIMKDFKSQTIDTPGVIQRVSRLFHGNPILIQGFNTFLPVGYRIDISTDPSNDNIITVTTPMGTTTQNTTAPPLLPRPGRDFLNPPGPLSAPILYPGPPPILPNLAPGPPPHALASRGFQSPQPQVYDPAFSPALANPQTTAAASFLGNLNNKNPTVEQKPAGEFNHAIQFLNKIKARYPEDPNMYKQFLDILQTYQKEQKQVQDTQVYPQVQMLFRDAPDLLAEFKAFLPEAVAGAAAAGGIAILPQPLGPGVPPAANWSQSQGEPVVSSPAAALAKKPTAVSKRKKKIIEKDPTPVPPSKPVPSRAKRVKHHHNADIDSPSFSPFLGPQSPQLQQAHAYHSGSQAAPAPHSHGVQPSTSLGQNQLASSADKLLFFDRAKKSLENREMYEEFLKLLSLFSKEIIDVKTLVERSRVFLGEGDLMIEFKELLGWDDKQDSIDNGPPGSIRTGPPEALSALPADDGEGPSYRKLPDSEIRLACSGRDELCRSVLNDKWVSHPTWASEESGFVAHKKNSFEEALHKSEEERHEYHVHIEALNRTIALLEPLNARIEEMTNEERTLFKLKSDFGGSSKSIYHRILKKIYGRDSGIEIISALQECPGVSVPVVLARLKQKDEEWRRAQREWSRTWREVDSKNFYKSLDHQGISFKQNDKKNITAKHFVQDIESIKNKQTRAWEQEGIQPFSRGSVGHQLEYSFEDSRVVLDSLKLVYSFLERSHAQYSTQERRSVEKFLRAFIPLLLNISVAEFNASYGPLESGNDDDATHDSNSHLEGSRSGRRSIGSTHSAQSGGVPASDLRKKLLRTAQERAARKEARGSTSALGSRAVSPSVAGNRSPQFLGIDDASGDTQDIWIRESGSSSIAEGIVSGSDSERPFFANTTFYTLVRLLQLLYSRLLMCKDIGTRLAEQKHAPLLANHVAVDLGLDDPNGPSAVLALAMEAVGTNTDGNVVYMYLLDACDKLFDNELDQATFEEHMRWFFGTKAYHLFTLDKLITALVKQVQTVLLDSKCRELWSLLQSAQSSEFITNQDVVRYRREAERHVGLDDHLYRIQSVRESKSIRVFLTGPDDPSVEIDGSSTARWREYINTYVMTYPTEWLPSAKKGASPVFLRRNVRNAEGTASTIDNYMKIRVNLPSYKLVYEDGCEDFILRRRGKEETEVLKECARARQEDRKRSRWISP
ncbi:histone deacetylase complex, SIN3 component [Crucibulum laeve]|uniref:Histone deacetylase complex, SIN3 component n=1 Tax=Crucibulum laeve TaxID=68775 RepID=A0A5C3MB83_9AGAR|nr:histone deacetylase complex, SIN3 component [Crucibulum laeve]